MNPISAIRSRMCPYRVLVEPLPLWHGGPPPNKSPDPNTVKTKGSRRRLNLLVRVFAEHTVRYLLTILLFVATIGT